MTRKELIDDAKEELYEAIQALEDDRLISARQCSARATGYICEAWKEFPGERKQ